MKRIIWGIIKIAVVVGLLVWIAYKFFPDTFEGDEAPLPDEIITEEITEPELDIDNETEVVEIESQEPVAQQNIGESMASKKARYARYSQGAGMPSAFTASISVQGTTVLSLQIAQALAESTSDWAQLSLHKKTFWILSELVQQDINVDMIYSLQGAMISVRNGEVSINFSGKPKTPVQSTGTSSSVSSRTVSTPTRVAPTIAKHLQVNPQTVVPFRTSNPTSAIYWGVVLDMDNVNSEFHKRPIYREAVSIIQELKQ